MQPILKQTVRAWTAISSGTLLALCMCVHMGKCMWMWMLPSSFLGKSLRHRNVVWDAVAQPFRPRAHTDRLSNRGGKIFGRASPDGAIASNNPVLSTAYLVHIHHKIRAAEYGVRIIRLGSVEMNITPV